MIVYITVAQVAKILKWTHHKTRRWLSASGALVLRGGRKVTTKDLLKQCFPEVYQEIMDRDYDSDNDNY